MTDSRGILAEQRKSLPIYEARKALVDRIFGQDVVVIIGETGSGKSTQIAQYLLEEGRLRGGVCLTQPRRVAAVTLAQRIAEERGSEVGQEIGYSVRFDEKSSAATKVKVVTDGMLLREAMVDPKLKRYDVVILDEAHERTIQTDILVSLLKRIQRARKRKLRIVIMSATLNPDIFLGYFNLTNDAVLYVAGRQYPVQTYYTMEPVEDFMDGVIQAVTQIQSISSTGDILVFLDGQETIESLKKLLRDHVKASGWNMAVLPFYSALNPRDQMKVFRLPRNQQRRVILATNIAETSVTIPNIVYVVDSGLHKMRTFDPNRSISRLQSVPVSRNSARQRLGRAGRLKPGYCYRLYTEATFYGSMEEQEPSEISRSNISAVMLTLLTLGVEDVVSWEYLERPSLDLIAGALEELAVLKAVDSKMRLTPLGRQIAVFPLDPALAKVLISAHEKQVLHDVCAVAAMLVTGNVFLPTHDRETKKDAAEKQRLFHSRLGDHLTLRNVFREYQRVDSHHKKWAKHHHINPRAMENAVKVYGQLLEYAFQNLGHQMDTRADDGGLEDEETDVEILKCILRGFFRNVALLNQSVDGKRGTYRTLGKSHLDSVQIHPSSVLSGSKTPMMAVVFSELVVTTKHYIRDVSVIDQAWLATEVPNFYKSVA